MVKIDFSKVIFKKCPVNSYDVHIFFDSDKEKAKNREVIYSLVTGFVNF